MYLCINPKVQACSFWSSGNIFIQTDMTQLGRMNQAKDTQCLSGWVSSPAVGKVYPLPKECSVQEPPLAAIYLWIWLQPTPKLSTLSVSKYSWTEPWAVRRIKAFTTVKAIVAASTSSHWTILLLEICFFCFIFPDQLSEPGSLSLAKPSSPVPLANIVCWCLLLITFP